MLQSAQPALFTEHRDVALSSLAHRHFDPSVTGDIDRPITVAFRGGSLLQALNAVAESSNGFWEIGYTGDIMHIALRTLSSEDGVTSIMSRIEPPGGE